MLTHIKEVAAVTGAMGIAMRRLNVLGKNEGGTAAEEISAAIGLAKSDPVVRSLIAALMPLAELEVRSADEALRLGRICPAERQAIANAAFILRLAQDAPGP